MSKSRAFSPGVRAVASRHFAPVGRLFSLIKSLKDLSHNVKATYPQFDDFLWIT